MSERESRLEVSLYKARQEGVDLWKIIKSQPPGTPEDTSCRYYKCCCGWSLELFSVDGRWLARQGNNTGSECVCCTSHSAAFAMQRKTVQIPL